MRVLAERISSYPFGPLFTLDDVELVWSGIKTGLIDILDEVAPEKTFYRRPLRKCYPWFDKTLTNLMK